MTHSIRPLLLTAILILSIATCAWGSPRVYPPYCTVPTQVRAVDTQAGVPDHAAGQFVIVIRDLANNVTNGASVVLDLSNLPDVVLCSDQMDPDVTMSCAFHTVRKFTNAQGQATFTLLGSSTGVNDTPSLGAGHVYANGVFVADVAVSVFDLDGASGVGANDLSIWLADFGSGEPHARSDYDGSGTVGAGDLSEWLGVFAAGTSTQSCTTSCP
jgi:hypothetical protein